MAWTDYAINVGYHDPNWSVIENFVDRCLEFSIDQQADAGMMGAASVQITLDNNDGALTPNNGGGYGTLPWFESVLQINFLISGGFARPMFAGMIIGFELRDDGVNSFVTLTAVDAFTVGGRSAVKQRATGTTYSSLGTMIEQLWSDPLGADVIMPAAGWAYGAVVSDILDPAPTELELDYRLDNLNAGAAMDEVNANILPAGPGVILPTTFEQGTGAIPATWSFVPADRMHRGSTNQTTFTFAENATTGELPFRGLRRGYNIDEVTNSVQLTPTLTGGTEQTATDSASISQFGARNRLYITADASNAQGLESAENWVKRFASVDFVAEQLQVTESMVTQQRGTEITEWYDLLNVTKGWWNPAQVTYTPTGGTERTDTVLITGRTISATPADTTVTLQLRPLANYWCFTLDSATLGVLDQNRLG